ncbi:MAG: membrane dipeptidase [Acidobacteria bacterium]|nr:membrane dipeptidase [Acidobacteriota bacterium]
MKKTSVALLLAAATGLAVAQQGTRPVDQVSEKARKLHYRAIVVDTHDDTTGRMLSAEDGFELGKRNATGHIDIPRMREGGMDAIFFSIYIPATVTGPEAVKRSLRLMDAVYESVRKYPKDLVLATTAADVRRAHKEGKIAALMGMEGGHMIDDDLGMLRMYARLGIRYLTLAHSRKTNWSGSSGETENTGLTEFGKDVVRELNRLGVMVDLSHVSDKTFWDAIEVSQAPPIASHSSCRAVCNAPRNMTDEMIQALAKKGGVIQITYVDSFISQELHDAQEAVRDEQRAKTDAAQKACAEGDATCRRDAARRVRDEYALRMPAVSWEKIIEHIDHAVKLVGPDHVGLGSDFDGATMPKGMDDVTYLPRITDALLKKGYKEKDIEKILGGNLLRVMEEVERVSARLNSMQK